MKNIKKFGLFEPVKVEGKDGVYEVEAYFEQLFIQNGNETFELWYTLRDKEHGGVIEVKYTQVSSAKKDNVDVINKLLDEYNDNLVLAEITNDNDYIKKAKYIMEKMKCGG